MKWRGRERSSNIEDRRGQGGGFRGGMGGGGFRIPTGGMGLPSGRTGGGLGIVGIIVVVGVMMLLGLNPLDMLTGGQSTSPSTQWAAPASTADTDELAEFVGVVVKDTEDFWGQVFQQNNMTYREPGVVLFTEATQSACGLAQSASGPFYCPNDQKIYIDLAFYEQLRRQFGAPGDFAQAYVVAHEVGHHVQYLTGVLPEFNRLRGQMSQTEQNAYSVRVELQADCYAGVWANFANRQNYLEQGDVEEAITAANAIGDDTLTRGQVSERNFTHGTSAQRMAALKKGMQSGDVGQCTL